MKFSLVWILQKLHVTNSIILKLATYLQKKTEVLTFQEKLLRVADPSPPFHEFLPLRLRQNNHNSVKRKLKISSLAPPNLA